MYDDDFENDWEIDDDDEDFSDEHVTQAEAAAAMDHLRQLSEKKVQYTLVGTDEGQSFISVFVAGQAPRVADDSHPQFEEIKRRALAGDDSVIGLFDLALAAGMRFERLTDRVAARNGKLFFDGEEVHNALARQVVRFIQDGVEDWKPLVNFFERIQDNPNDHSRAQLYLWLDAEDFTITEDGMIIGYKSVRSNGDGSFKSINSGQAIVNGVVQDGQIEQKIGDVVEMPRETVMHDPASACNVGLHVGTHEYASRFSGDTLLEVTVNPRDVVSVPTDSGGSKMRTCRYTIVGVLPTRSTKIAEPVQTSGLLKRLFKALGR